MIRTRVILAFTLLAFATGCPAEPSETHVPKIAAPSAASGHRDDPDTVANVSAAQRTRTEKISAEQTPVVKAASFEAGFGDFYRYESFDPDGPDFPAGTEGVSTTDREAAHGKYAALLRADASSHRVGLRSPEFELPRGTYTLGFSAKAVTNQTRITARAVPLTQKTPVPEVEFICPAGWERRSFVFSVRTPSKWSVEFETRGPMGRALLDAVTLRVGTQDGGFEPTTPIEIGCAFDNPTGVYAAGASGTARLLFGVTDAGYDVRAGIILSVSPQGLEIEPPPVPFVPNPGTAIGRQYDFRAGGAGLYRLDFTWDMVPGEQFPRQISTRTVFVRPEIANDAAPFFGLSSAPPEEWREFFDRLRIDHRPPDADEARAATLDLGEIAGAPEEKDMRGETVPSIFVAENRGRPVARGGSFAVDEENPDRAAAYLARQALLLRAAGFDKWRLDLARDPRYPFSPLLDAYLNVRPLAAAASFQAHLLDGAKIVSARNVSPGTILQTYLRRDGRPVAVLWHWLADTDPGLALAVADPKIFMAARGLYGHSIEIATDERSADIPVRIEPVYILGNAAESAGFFSAFAGAAIPEEKEKAVGPRLYSYTADGTPLQTLRSEMTLRPDGFTIRAGKKYFPLDATGVGVFNPGFPGGTYRVTIVLAGDASDVRAYADGRRINLAPTGDGKTFTIDRLDVAKAETVYLLGTGRAAVVSFDFAEAGK